MKRTLVYLTIIMLCACSLIYILTNGTHEKKLNGFKRIKNRDQLIFWKAIQLPSKTLFFASDSGKLIYLKDHLQPDILFSINDNLEGVNRTNLNLNDTLLANKKNLQVCVSDSFIYVSDVIKGTISLKSFNNSKTYIFKTPNITFDEANLLSNGSTIVREVVLQNNEFSRNFVKFRFIGDTGIKKRIPIKKQLDGFFSNDGLLKSNIAKDRLIYTYFYQGKFLCLDSNLNLVYAAKTIDTINFAKLKLASVTTNSPTFSGTKVSTANPSHFVNKNFTIYKNFIFIISGLRADNETSSEYGTHQPVDVYRIDNGKYVYSFYVPIYQSAKLRELRIRDNKIYCIFEDHLVAYNIPEKSLPLAGN